MAKRGSKQSHNPSLQPIVPRSTPPEPAAMSEHSLGLNSSKRKFYKLLDNLSSSKVHLPADRNASTTTLAAEQAPNKRFRLLGKDRPTTAPSSRPLTAGAKERPRSSIFTVGSNAAARISRKSLASERAGAARGEGEEVKQPNYAPWSHDLFLGRLKTFADVRQWTPKPPAIGEVEWAKRGWTVVAKDTVGCKGGCEKRLVVKIADKEGQENRKPGEGAGAGKEDEEDGDGWWLGDLEAAMVEKYQGLIGEAHTEECLWRRAGCKEDIYRIKMTDPVIWQSELRERYLSLLDVEEALPTRFDLRAEDGDDSAKLIFDIDELAELIPAEVLKRPQSQPQAQGTAAAGEDAVEAPALNINKNALTLAILGWTGQKQNNVKLATCPKCFQRAGLWLYSKPPTEGSEDMIFNPVAQHREHCPWKNGYSQQALGRLAGLTGWQVLVSLIKGYRRHDTSPKKKTPSRPQSMYDSEGFMLEDDEDTPVKSRAELEKEDKERKSKLAKLKRAFTVKKANRMSMG